MLSILFFLFAVPDLIRCNWLLMCQTCLRQNLKDLGNQTDLMPHYCRSREKNTMGESGGWDLFGYWQSEEK